MKRALCYITATVLLLSLLAGCGPAEENAAEPAAVNVGGILGPTGMALVHLRERSEAGEEGYNYNVTFEPAPDVVQARLMSGEIDIGALPTNMASVVFNRTGGDIRILAVSRLNILYILTAPGVEISSVADLRGKTLFTAGQGATQEYVLDYLLRESGLDPAADLTVEYKSEHAEVVALLLDGKCDAALLPQPHVTSAMKQNPGLKMAIDINEEWKRLNADVELAMSCIVARKDFLEENPAAGGDFLKHYAESAAFPADNPEEAAALMGEYGVIPEAVALEAIPHSGLACVTGDEMKAAVKEYLEILYRQNPQSAGGSLPDDGIFY
ncbi:MAG: ABC transporter substrate-binding protein, partial [Oscillospiraceae bacterium]|nr:ABC transporter substrate-binding protein [Oscillospiraceae bacterium]